jgi:hypothetical protein
MRRFKEKTKNTPKMLKRLFVFFYYYYDDDSTSDSFF